MKTPVPNGCTWCGVEKREHMTRWAMGPGLHQWAEPENWQRKQRMQERRAAQGEQ